MRTLLQAPFRLINDLLHAIDRWRQWNTFEFWALIYFALFCAPSLLWIFTDIARHDHHHLFMIAWATLFG